MSEPASIVRIAASADQKVSVIPPISIASVTIIPSKPNSSLRIFSLILFERVAGSLDSSKTGTEI